MNRLLAATSASALVLASALTASAQQPPANCPPGSWFCADVQVSPPPAPPPPQYASPQQYAPLPAPLPPPPPPQQYAPPPQYPPQPRYAPAPPPPQQGGTRVYVQQAPPAQPPVVIYQQPYTQQPQGTYVIVRPAPYAYPSAPPPPPPPPYWDRQRDWGLNLHVMGIGMGHGSNSSSGMVGAGASLRYKLSPAFALESGLDVYGGTDYNGLTRTEEALTVNGLIFLNPHNRFQFYLLGGFGWSWAHVNGDTMGLTGSMNGSSGPTSVTADYKYFGGQLGFGSELHITRGWALNADIRGFVRSRIGVPAGDAPEFTSSTGQTTNTSGGAVFTAGTTFYF